MTDPPSSDPGPATEARGARDGSLPGLPNRIVQVFVSPAALFDRLKETPVWIGMLLAVLALTLAFMLLIPEEALLEMGQANQRAGTDQPQIDPAVARAFMSVGAVGLTLITILIVAGFLILVYNVLLGDEGTFRQLLSVTAHGFVISAVGALLTLALIVSRGEMTTLSLNLLIPGLEEGFLFRLLRAINVFSLWTAVVLGIGVSRIYPKRSAGAATVLLIVLYVLLMAILAALGVGQ